MFLEVYFLTTYKIYFGFVIGYLVLDDRHSAF